MLTGALILYRIQPSLASGSQPTLRPVSSTGWKRPRRVRHEGLFMLAAGDRNNVLFSRFMQSWVWAKGVRFLVQGTGIRHRAHGAGPMESDAGRQLIDDMGQKTAAGRRMTEAERAQTSNINTMRLTPAAVRRLASFYRLSTMNYQPALKVPSGTPFLLFALCAMLYDLCLASYPVTRDPQHVFRDGRVISGNPSVFEAPWRHPGLLHLLHPTSSARLR
jgi:hypothetical protein